MNLSMLTAVALLSATLAGGPVRAATLEQDEAKIDALIRAERAARQPKAVAPVVTLPASDEGSPAPVVASVVAPSNPAMKPPTASGGSAPDDRGLGFGQLAQNVGRRVVIVTAGEKVHRGIVQSADAGQVVLRVTLSGGNAATYSLSRNQVTRIDLR